MKFGELGRYSKNQISAHPLWLKKEKTCGTFNVMHEFKTYSELGIPVTITNARYFFNLLTQLIIEFKIVYNFFQYPMPHYFCLWWTIRRTHRYDNYISACHIPAPHPHHTASVWITLYSKWTFYPKG